MTIRHKHRSADTFFIIILPLIALPCICLPYFIGFDVSDNLYQAFTCFYLIFFIANFSAVSISYFMYLGQENSKRSWLRLAKLLSVNFVPGNFLNGGAYLIGKYRGHQLKLMANRKLETRTQIVLSKDNLVDDNSSLKDGYTLDREFTTEDVTKLFHSIKIPPNRKGQLRVGPAGQQVYYEQIWLETDEKFLRFLFDQFSDLIDAYPRIVSLGGEVIPFLQSIALDQYHLLQQTAKQLLRDLEKETLDHQNSRLLCRHCLARFTAHKVHLSHFESITYYGCRICGQSQDFFEGQVVVVLESRLTSEQSQQNGVLRVNWLVYRNLFDFDAVEIIQATDEEVELFVMQIGNDTDPVRQLRHKQICCTVSPDCQLSENTIRILQRIIGQVEIKGENSGKFRTSSTMGRN